MNSSGTIPWKGIAAGTSAAIFYTFANVFLRKLATEVDFVVVVFIKALTTFCIFLPWLCLTASKYERVLPSGKALWILLFAAVQVQIFGNVGQQISFGIVGMAVGVPIYIGSLVASSAILGYFFLREKISWKVSLALAVLIASVVLLSQGGESACEAVKKQQTLWLSKLPFIWGALAAIGTGIAFAVLAVCIRFALKADIPPTTPVVVVSMTGAIGFGLTTFIRDGVGVIDQYSLSVWGAMFAAGVCNAIAFLSLSLSLKLLPVVYVNAINVSQVAMAAAFGVMLFCEPLSIWLTFGLILMVTGFGLLAQFGRQNDATCSPNDCK